MLFLKTQLQAGIGNERQKRILGWLGTVFLLQIIPLKLIRCFPSEVFQTVSNNTPSFFGSAGLFFIFLADQGRFAKIKIYQALCLTLILSVIIEFLQLLPRPGILSKIYYVFDLNDLVASFAGVVFSFIITASFISTKEVGKNQLPDE